MAYRSALTVGTKRASDAQAASRSRFGLALAEASLVLHICLAPCAHAVDISNAPVSVAACKPRTPCVSTAAFMSPSQYLPPWGFEPETPLSAQIKLLRELELMGASPMPTFDLDPGPSSLQQSNNIDVHTEVEEGYAGPARAPAGSEQAQRSTANATSHGSVRVRVPFQVAGRVEVDEMEFVFRDTLILFRSEAVDGGLGGPDPAFCWVTNCVSGPRQRARLEALRDALGWSVEETDEDKRWVQIMLH
ncbi:hypothetical protein QJQ45_027274 [Haematococcus lacustris]|nr:hypothetical protein QJQ45_027274 [Haematococcus lacustris]